VSFAPVFVPVGERTGARLQPVAPGRWFHAIPGTDIVENVYDPRRWEKNGPYGLRPRVGLGQTDDSGARMRALVLLALVGGGIYYWHLGGARS